MRRRAPRNMPRWLWRGLLGAAIGLLIALLAVGLNTWRGHEGWTLGAESPAARFARLQPDLRMVPPTVPPRKARALLLSGCDGVRDNMDFWAHEMAELGRPALVLDSHAPRGLDRMNGWRLVCVGQILTGAERAGDAAVALARSSAEVTLLGTSHGGWTALELLAQMATGSVPPGLTGWPAPVARLRRKLAAVVVLYPYCGVMNGADRGDWSGLPPILMILAEHDEIISTPACETLAQNLRARGAEIEVVVLPGVGHGFDQRERAPFSPLEFYPKARDHAARLVREALSAR